MAREIYDLEIRVNVSGNHVANVFKLYIDDPTVPDEYQNAKDIIDALPVGAGPTAWLFRYRALISGDCYISNIICRRSSTGGGNTAQAVLQTDTLPGLAMGTVCATQVAGCVIWVNQDEPDVTGRSFIPGVSKEDIDGGRFFASYYERVENFIARTAAGLNISAGIAYFGIYQRVPQTIFGITGGYLSPKVGTQRRREQPL